MNRKTSEPDHRSGWWWTLVPIIAVAGFIYGYSAVPSLREAVDKLVARVSQLNSDLGKALGERDDALFRMSSLENEKKRLNELIAQLQHALQAAKAEAERLKGLLTQEANPPEEPPPPPNLPVAGPVVIDSNGQCQNCGNLLVVSDMLIERKDNIRCPVCKVIMSARRAVAFRDYVRQQEYLRQHGR